MALRPSSKRSGGWLTRWTRWTWVDEVDGQFRPHRPLRPPELAGVHLATTPELCGHGLTGLRMLVYPPSMHDPIAAKYAHLEDPGIREFMIAGEGFYPPDAVTFTLAEQRRFYDLYCTHFRKPRPVSVTAQDFQAGHVPCRLYKTNGTAAPPVMLYLHGGGFV